MNKILRHYIGREGRYESGWSEVRCIEGAWVLLEDLLRKDYIWRDKRYYDWEEKNDYASFLETRRSRIGVIVELTVAESRQKGKTRFQIMGLMAENQGDLDAIIRHHDINPPTAGTTPFGETYGGWVMPIAVRATKKHSKEIAIPLDPTRLFKRLDLRMALGLQGA